MKIYFAGSIRGGRGDVDLYRGLVAHLQTHGEVLTEHISHGALTAQGETGHSTPHIHDRDMQWLGECDVIVAEVTTPSSGVGYEIGRMVERNIWVNAGKEKPILCLYRPQADRNLSAMIDGSDGVTIRVYNSLEEGRGTIDDFLSSL